MSGTSLLVLVVVGIVAGWLAGKIMKGRGFGLIGDLVVGVIGAFLGSWLFGVLHVSVGSGLVSTFITALVGSLVLLMLLRLIRSL